MLPILLPDAAYVEIRQSAHKVYDAFQAFRAASAALDAARSKSPAALKRAQKAFSAALAASNAISAAHNAMATAHHDAAVCKANDRHYKRIAAMHKKSHSKLEKSL